MATKTGHPTHTPKFPSSQWYTSTVVQEGRVLQVVLEVRPRPADDWHTRGRAYVWCPEPLEPHPPYSRKGEDPDNDALWRAYNRLEIAQSRAVLMSVVHTGAWAFSVYAGCECPCSPGFIDQSGRWHRKDLYIHAK